MAYWLFKTEPGECSIDDFANTPDTPIVWEGVRNYQARNMLRDQVKAGDLVFIYHSSCKLIGVAGIVRTTPEHQRAEIGYLLAGEHQKKGIISEALKEILAYGFLNLKLHLIEAVTDPRNTASISVLKKLGFTMDGHFRENTLHEGQFWDSMHFSLLARDYKG